MRDLWEKRDLDGYVQMVANVYCQQVYGKSMPIDDALLSGFRRAAGWVASMFKPATIRAFNEPLFEGAQGLMLDCDNRDYWPHLTNSKTGIHNVLQLCREAEIDVEPWYVSRTYLTRHGAGPMPFEDRALRFPDDTNVENEWQGKLRFGRIDPEWLLTNIEQDVGERPFRLFFTHCDQMHPPCEAHRYSYGVTADDVYPRRLDDWEIRRYGKEVESATA